MAKIAENLTDLIGYTPLMRLTNFMENNKLDAEIVVKIESFNPLGSVKDRAALAMVVDAEERGLLKEGATIVEPTSGNTGIGLAYISAIRKYHLILTMPETMSIERRKLLAALGAEIQLTPGEKGMQGAIERAQELVKEIPGAFNPDQFGNPANPAVHKATTAKEIILDTDGELDYFIAGVGSGGTISGIGEALKDFKKEIQVVAIEPDTSAVLSGEAPGPHGLQGIGAGFIPTILNRDVIDEVIKITDDEAYAAAREVGKSDGLLIGISAGAAIAAAVKIANRPEAKGKRIVVILPDTGERYLSTALFTE